MPKNELKPEQFPKAVVEALRREGDAAASCGAGKIREHQKKIRYKFISEYKYKWQFSYVLIGNFAM